MDVPKLDKTVVNVTTHEKAAAEDRAYWHRQTPAARLRHLQLLRELNYGSAANGRVERVFEVVKRRRGGGSLAGRNKDLDDLESHSEA